ncbi:MAG: hypothetical protein IH956_06965, partial [Chloroflexi bacterium]|nr:hypothetical protein [Chloroflexota bacterium]
MRIGAFEVGEPVPELKNTCAIAMLRPWIDVGRVGTLVLNKLEKHLGAKELGRLARPGTFFDFTQYRPRIRNVEGRRVLTIPNSSVQYAHDDDSGIRGWLNKQDKQTLVNLLDERALFDAELHELLSFKAAATDFSLPVQKKLIRQAIGTWQFVAYREMRRYTRRIDAAVDNLESLFRDGIGAPLVELCEYALRRVETAMGHVDDSDGYMSPLLGRLEDLHLAACERARPEPKKLAKRLYKWQIDGDWDTFRDAVEKYATVLGDA